MFESKHLNEIVPYKLSSHKAWDESAKKVIKLDWNEATIDPSPKVYERILSAIKESKLNWYPNINNNQLLKKLASYNSIPVDNIQYFSSSDSLHEYIVRAFIQENDNILIVGPTYDNFRAVAEANGGKINYYYLNDVFQLNFEVFHEELIIRKPKVVYIVNPNNPTGTKYSGANLKTLFESFPEILFIVDEAYYEFCGETVSNLTTIQTNLLVSRTFSKAFALASFRIGYTIAHPTLISSLNKIRNAKSVPLLAQIAAEAALDDLEYTNNYIIEVNTTKDWFYDFLLETKLAKPIYGFGNFLFVEFESCEKKNRVVSFLESRNIYIRDYGHIQGFQNYARITIGSKDQMVIVRNVLIEFTKL